jgi:hypothetical protein
MKLSKKKEDQLYELVHKHIMNARLKIWKMKDQPNISISEIDDILSDLSINAPRAAIDLFKQKKQ